MATKLSTAAEKYQLDTAVLIEYMAKAKRGLVPFDANLISQHTSNVFASKELLEKKIPDKDQRLFLLRDLFSKEALSNVLVVANIENTPKNE